MKKILYIFILMFLCGCFKLAAPPIKKLTDAHKKLIKLTEETLKATPKLTEAENTLWIYLPSTDNIITIKASGEKTTKTNKPSENLSIKYIDSSFKDNAFYIEYDIAQDKKYNKDFGYTSTYSDKYQREQKAFISNIQRAYGDIEKAHEDISFKDSGKNDSHKELASKHVKTTSAPDFFIFVIADIKNGIEAQTTIYYKDIPKILSPIMPLPIEESSMRYLSDIRGNNAIINDTEGKHIDYTNMTLPKFLAKQIVNRIYFKYTRSSFPPSNNTTEEILKIIAKTINLYDFNQFKKIILHDLNTDTTENFTIEDLEKYKEKKKAEKSPKYHIIKFNVGKE